MRALPVFSLNDLQRLLESEALDPELEFRYGLNTTVFPFYSVLLYTQMNGLNERVRGYVRDRWETLSMHTGPNWLVAILEDWPRGHEVGVLQPDDVFGIARHLGIGVDRLPCIAFFTDPKSRNEILVLRLREALPGSESLTDEHITTLIGTIATAVDTCSERIPGHARLACLRTAAESRWKEAIEHRVFARREEEFQWGQVPLKAPDWFEPAAADRPTVFAAIHSSP